MRINTRRYTIPAVSSFIFIKTPALQKIVSGWD